MPNIMQISLKIFETIPSRYLTTTKSGSFFVVVSARLNPIPLASMSFIDFLPSAGIQQCKLAPRHDLVVLGFTSFSQCLRRPASLLKKKRGEAFGFDVIGRNPSPKREVLSSLVKNNIFDLFNSF